MAKQEYKNIYKELDGIHKQLTTLHEIKELLVQGDFRQQQLPQLNDKSTIGTDHSGLTTSPPIKPSESIDDEGGLVKHISTQTDTSTNLCIPDLNDVVETLKTKGCNFGDARWMDLGLALGLYMSTLEEIELNFNKNPSRCLKKTIDKWMRRADNVMSKGRPSWDTLADALRRIDENTSAQYITEQRMRLEALSASNDAVRDGAIINVVKDASQSLVDQNMMKIDELMEKMESIVSKPQKDINHQLMEMKKEIKQLNEINEQLKVHLDELNQLKNKLQETDLAKKQMSHDLDKYRSLYETVEVQLQSKNKEIEELNDKQKKAAIVLGKFKSSNKDITHQLETKTKQLEELTEIHMTTKSELDELKQKELAVEVQLQSKNKEIEELNDKQKKAAIELGKLNSASNKDITHQLETKTKQLEELTEIHMTTKSELDQLKQKELAVEVQLQSKNKEVEELNDKQKKAAIELIQLKPSNKDITHQLETKTKQLKELTIDIESSPSVHSVNLPHLRTQQIQAQEVQESSRLLDSQSGMMNTEKRTMKASKIQFDVDLLNHVIEDLEIFMKKLIEVDNYKAQLELLRKTTKRHRVRMRTLSERRLWTERTRTPSDEEFITVYQKIKYAINLVAKLGHHLLDPPADIMLEKVFVYLKEFMKKNQAYLYGSQVAALVIAPLLHKRAIDLMLRSLSAENQELWNKLGANWTISKEQWPPSNSLPEYTLILDDECTASNIHNLSDHPANFSTLDTLPRERRGSNYSDAYDSRKLHCVSSRRVNPTIDELKHPIQEQLQSQSFTDDGRFAKVQGYIGL